MSGQQYRYGGVTFDLGICDASSNIYTGFKLKIKGLSSHSIVSGRFSIAVDELKWVSNGWNFDDLSKGQSENISFFESALLNNLESLTLRISVIFY
eukprot:1070038_1